MIEAGGDEPTGTQVPSMFLNFLGSSIDWGYNTEPEEMACLSSPERKCNWPRGKVMYKRIHLLFCYKLIFSNTKVLGFNSFEDQLKRWRVIKGVKLT